MTKFKFLFITLLLSAFSVSLFANNLSDSIGVENQNGKKVILHKVDPKENFYSIARKYKVEPKVLMAFNDNLKTLAIGQTIKVPTDIPFAVAAKFGPGANTNFTVRTSPAMQQTANNSGATTQYKVSTGETLYAISKRFNTTVADITALNNLTSTTLTPGQILLVHADAPPATVPVKEQAVVQKPVQQPVVTPPVQAIQPPPTPVAKRDTTMVATQDTADMNHRSIPANRYGLLEKNEKGIAIWMDSDNLDPTKKWVLHRTAAIGTIIKITNPMTNRTTFAKVVGRFTDNEDNKDALMIITKSVAESVGAVDKRFHVTISYAPPNE